jgi:hypothetical protein
MKAKGIRKKGGRGYVRPLKTLGHLLLSTLSPEFPREMIFTFIHVVWRREDKSPSKFLSFDIYYVIFYSDGKRKRRNDCQNSYNHKYITF